MHIVGHESDVFDHKADMLNIVRHESLIRQAHVRVRHKSRTTDPTKQTILFCGIQNSESNLIYLSFSGRGRGASRNIWLQIYDFVLERRQVVCSYETSLRLSVSIYEEFAWSVVQFIWSIWASRKGILVSCMFDGLT